MSKRMICLIILLMLVFSCSFASTKSYNHALKKGQKKFVPRKKHECSVKAKKKNVAVKQKAVSQKIIKRASLTTEVVAPVNQPIVNKKSLLSDICTNFNVSMNTYQPEDAQINQAQLAANLSLSKGPVYIQYSHTRIYSRYVNPYIPQDNTNFQASVNNQVVLGVSGVVSAPIYASSNATNNPTSTNIVNVSNITALSH